MLARSNGPFTLLAVAALAAACSTTPVRPSAPARALFDCPGGAIQTAAEASKYHGCEVVTGDLTIDGSELVSLAELTGLKEITGSLVIRNNAELGTLEGLESLRRTGELVIERNAALISLAALDKLESAERVRITKNPRLSKTFGFMRSFKYGSCHFELKKNAGLEAEGLKSGHDLVAMLDARETKL